MKTNKNMTKRNNTQITIDPRAFPNLLPVHIPQRTWKTNIVSGYIRKIKLKQVAEEAKLNADIACDQDRMVQANCNMVKRISTLSAEIQATLGAYEYQKQKGNAEVNKLILENEILYYQAEQEKIAYENAKKAQKEIYPEDGTSEA